MTRNAIHSTNRQSDQMCRRFTAKFWLFWDQMARIFNHFCYFKTFLAILDFLVVFDIFLAISEIVHLVTLKRDPAEKMKHSIGILIWKDHFVYRPYVLTALFCQSLMENVIGSEHTVNNTQRHA